MKSNLIIIFICFLMISCNSNQNNSSSENVQSIANEDSLRNEFDYQFDIIYNSVDTVKLISHDHYFYYCFGKFENPHKLTEHFGKLFKVNKESTYVFNDSTQIDTLFRIVHLNSFIKFFFDEEENLMQLVSGRIIGTELQMTNNLRVGLTRDEVEIILFKENKHRLKATKVVQIITALEGIWIDLVLDNQRLQEIKIDSDYQVNKT